MELQTTSMLAPDFINYLDTISGLDIIQAYKRDSFALLNVKPGDSILDIGCGAGTDTLDLARLVGAAGYVTGLDLHAEMVAEAHIRSLDMGLPVNYVLGDATRLGFDDCTFDACRADRVLHMMRDPQGALAEMIRVTRVGGHIVVSEPDWETILIDSPFRGLTRKILHFLCDAAPSSWIGRQLPRLFKQNQCANITTTLTAGTLNSFDLANRLLHLDDIVSGAIQAGVIDWVEGVGWLQLLKEANEAGTFFCGMTGVTVCGQKSAAPDQLLYG